MKFTLLKVKTKTCEAIFQKNSENDSVTCITSTNYKEFLPGSIDTLNGLGVWYSQGDIESIIEL